jgi:hypothetical protein
MELRISKLLRQRITRTHTPGRPFREHLGCGRERHFGDRERSFGDHCRPWCGRGRSVGAAAQPYRSSNGLALNQHARTADPPSRGRSTNLGRHSRSSIRLLLTKSNSSHLRVTLGSVGRMAREVATKAIGRLAFRALMASGRAAMIRCARPASAEFDANAVQRHVSTVGDPEEMNRQSNEATAARARVRPLSSRFSPRTRGILLVLQAVDHGLGGQSMAQGIVPRPTAWPRCFSA